MNAKRRLERTPLADAAGILLAGDLAPRLLDHFDYCELALASRVSRRWRDAAARLEVPRKRDFFARPIPSQFMKLAVRLTGLNLQVARELEEMGPEPALNADPTASRFSRLWEQAVCSHVVDAGVTSVASYVAFIEYAASREVTGLVLVVAKYDEVDKWNAAFQGKDYFCGDLDAEPLRGNATDLPDSGLRVYVCSEACLLLQSHLQRRRILRHRWQFLVVDAGAHRASAMSLLDDEIRAETCHIFSRPLPRAGLDLEEATFRVRLLMKSIYRHAGLSQSVFEVWKETDGDTREGKYLRWLVQRDFNRRLTSDATTVTIGVTPL